MVNIRLAASAVFLFVGSCLLYNRNETGDMQRSLREDIGRDEIEKLVKIAKAKLTVPEPGALGVVINTPKCGTGGLTQTFARSFSPCMKSNNITAAETEYFQCAEDRVVLRTHDVKHGIEALKEIRKDPETQQCLIVTAIRHPEHWLPSMFLQCREGRDLCDTKISREEYFRRYHDWLMFEREMNKARNAVREVRPVLLKSFGATSLASEMRKVEQNGGYSLLDNPPSDSAYANCKLLFLRMEDHAKWPSILGDVMPGIRYSNAASRVDKCPNTADHYRALQEYKLSEEEKASVLGDDPDMYEYFRVYGLV